MRWPDAVVSWNLDGLSVQEVTARLLRDIIKQRQEANVKNATIRRDLTAVGSLLNQAAYEGWIDENPAVSLNLRRLVPERAIRIVLPQEPSIALLFGRMSARMRDLREFTPETGLRLDGATSLRHGTLDRVERTITIVAGKGDKTRFVPLTALAETIIDRQPRFIGKPWIFWTGKGEQLKRVSASIGGLTATVARLPAAQRPEFHRFGHHAFRQLFAVEYLRYGCGSIYDLQQLLGHSTITERYLAFLTPDQVRAAKSTVTRDAQHLRSESAATA